MGAAEDISVQVDRVLVTGGGGFVGRAVVNRLLEAGTAVTVLGRHRYDDLAERGVRLVTGDIADSDAVHSAVEGADLVFHTAAKAGVFGTREMYFHPNVLGAECVLNVCLERELPLVYTSTPSVVFNGKDILGAGEELPHAERFLCNYAETKSYAENLILAEADRIPVCAIRPHLIWGPGDPHLLPRLIAAGKEGELRIVGDGSNLVDISYIDNVAEVHLCAGAKLLEGKGSVANGRAYFIGQKEPVNLWGWLNDLFIALDLPPVERHISFASASRIGAVLEAGCTFLNFFGLQREPRMTRFVAEQLARSHWFSHAAAERDLGYHELVSTEEGLRRALPWLREHCL